MAKNPKDWQDEPIPFDAPVPFAPAASSSREAPKPATGTVAEAVAAIRARKPPPKPPKGVHGRRAAGYVQLNLTVRPEVKRRLEAAARAGDVSMAELLDELLDRHLPGE